MDSEAIARVHGLDLDERYFYLRFLGLPCRIERATGRIENSSDGFRSCSEAGFSQSLAIYDYLRRPAPLRPSGLFGPVNSLRGLPPGHRGVNELHGDLAALFDRCPEGFAAAARSLGGQSWPIGDLGFRLQVFEDVPLLLGLYRADEDFPASLLLQWDLNTLQVLLYESLFYVAGCLLQRLRQALPDTA